MPPVLHTLISRRTPGGGPDSVPPASAHLVARLRRSGLQINKVRIAILSTLARLNAPVTLRELQEAVGPAPVAFASVYRCMLRFENVRLVRRVIGFNGTLRWELDAGTRKDFQIICRRSGEAAGLDEESSLELRRLLNKVERRLRACGYTQLNLNVAFYGRSSAVPFGGSTETLRERIA